MSDIQSLITTMAERYGLDPDIFRRLIKAESNFNPNAVSEDGALGLGQIMPDTARSPGYRVTPLSKDKMFDPAENLRFSAEYFRAMLDRPEIDGDYRLAAAAYNAGLGAVKKHDGVPPFKETQDYVGKIFGGEGLGSLNGSSESGGADSSELSALLSLISKEEDEGSSQDDSMLRGLASLQAVFAPDAEEFVSIAPAASVSRGKKTNPLQGLGLSGLSDF